MKKFIFAISLFFMLSGCVGTISPTANVISGNTIDVSSVNKRGNACSYYILGLFGPFGDNSVIKAAKNAQISKVTYYDRSLEYYVVFARDCNRVYGY